LWATRFGLERFHLSGSWNGWMMTSDCFMDGLLWCLSYHLVNFLYFRTLNLYWSWHEPWFVTIKPFRENLDLNCVMYSRLAFMWVLMHRFDPLFLCKCFHRAWPNNLRRDDTLLLLNGQMGWLSRW
jgi:hypothetical protein